jgi:hypothetical protein
MSCRGVDWLRCHNSDFKGILQKGTGRRYTNTGHKCAHSTHRIPISQCSMLRCCSQCPRISSSSGLSRHRKTCKIFRQSMDSSLRLAQYADHTQSMAIRTGLQANQQVVGVEAVEGSDTERIQTDVTVSSIFIIFPQMLLTRCSPLSLMKQTLTRVTRRHCPNQTLFLSPRLYHWHIPPCQNQAARNARTNFLLDIGTHYLNRHHPPF